MFCWDFPINTKSVIKNRDTTISLRMIEVATFSSNSRSLKWLNLISGIAYGALLPGSESILSTSERMRISLRFLSSTPTKTKVVRKQPHGQHVYLECLSCYVFPKCVGSVATKPFSATYPSLFAMASPSSPAIVDVTCECIFVSFIMRIKFVF